MVKHGRNKKRRAGRLGKTKLKNCNYQFHKPAQISDSVIREKWQVKKSLSSNMTRLGLVVHPNGDAADRGNAPPPVVPGAATAIELFDIPESDVIPKQVKTMLPVSEEDQKYMERLFKKHGDDYTKMARDIKTNDMQHSLHRLKKIGGRFFLLTEKQLRVEVPENVKHLMRA